MAGRSAGMRFRGWTHGYATSRASSQTCYLP